MKYCEYSLQMEDDTRPKFLVHLRFWVRKGNVTCRGSISLFSGGLRNSELWLPRQHFFLEAKRFETFQLDLGHLLLTMSVSSMRVRTKQAPSRLANQQENLDRKQIQVKQCTSKILHFKQEVHRPRGRKCYAVLMNPKEPFPSGILWTFPN
jgi:hypothetical protein